MQLLFIYNADSGKVNALLDSVHKIISPGTYDCKLCDLTFGLFSERSAWKEFRKSRQEEMIFLHRDEFESRYRSKWLHRYDYPVILHTLHGQLEILVSKEEMEGLADSNALIRLLQDRLTPG